MVPEEQVVIEPEVPAQEVQEEEELQECPDHQPSSFKKDKPQSILSLLLHKAITLSKYIYIVALHYRS